MCCPASAAPSAPSSKANPCSRSPHSFPPQSPPPPIHPSPLPGGRLGGGWEATNQHHRSSRAPIAPPHAHRTHPLRRAYPSRHTRIPSATPAPPSPSFLRRQEPPTSTSASSPIHPSPLPGGRLGGGWKVASQHHRSPHAPITHATHPSRHSCAGRNPRPLPSFLRRREPAPPPRHSCAGRNPRPPSPPLLRLPSVIPAQAGITHPNIRPLPQFIPPPYQGGG